MKQITFPFLLLAFVSFSMQAQTLGDRIVDRTKGTVNNRVEQKVDKTVNKGIDKVEDKVDSTATGKKKEKADSGSGTNSGNGGGSDSGSGTNSGAKSEDGNKSGGTKNLTTYSKYDFVPGEKILVQEDFMQDAVGDFPAKWNTNSSGEIVTVDGTEGHWFKMQKEGCFLPEFITDLPDNFTMEYDLIVPENFNFYSTSLMTSFVHADKPATEFMKWARFPSGEEGVRFDLHPTNAGNNGGGSHILVRSGGHGIMENEVTVNNFHASEGKTKVHVSVWRQKGRMRVYVNENKVWDLPRAFQDGIKYNTVVFTIGGMHQESDFYLISNLRLAVGAPDTRNKLITEGKLVTRGILFSSGSDVILPESYGTLKDIAQVLKENPDVKVKIIGHTDSDGEDKTNMDLSKKRAAAVKNALVKDFGIDASRIETDGKGEGEPAEPNTTPAGKANNRRVEFIKQ
jgi:OmpA-OmpF porin, OOP family